MTNSFNICPSCGRVVPGSNGLTMCPACAGKQKNGQDRHLVEQTASQLRTQLDVSQAQAINMAKENLRSLPSWEKRSRLLSDKQYLVITDVGSTTTKALLLKQEPKGQWVPFGLQHAATTVEKPVEDVNIGVFNAITALQKQTGAQVLAQGATPENLHFNDSIAYLTTSSAGGGLQIVVVGLTMFDSAASGRRAAYGAGGVLLDTFAVNDKRTAAEQMAAMQVLHPDIVLMAGGTEGGAISSILRLGEILNVAEPRPKFGAEKVPLVYAGNSQANEFIAGMFANKFELYIVPNIRPTLVDENLAPAREKIHDLFLEKVMEQAPGYARLKTVTTDPIIPTPIGVINSLQNISETLNTNVLSVDIGGATTDVFSNIRGYYFRTVSANFGMSYSAANVLAEYGWDDFKQLLPKSFTQGWVRNYIYNKTVHPLHQPANTAQLIVEHALAKAALRMSRKHHLQMNFSIEHVGYLDRLRRSDMQKIVETFYFEREQERKRFHMYQIDVLIGAGGVISHTQTNLQAFLIIAEGLKPEGVTKIMRDRYFTSPHLGKLSELDEKSASHLLQNNCYQQLGTYVRPVGKKVKAGKPVLSVTANGTTTTINSGQAMLFNTPGQAVKISMKKGFHLSEDKTEFELSTDLPVLIDARQNDDPDFELSALTNAYNWQEPLPQMESEFLPLLPLQNMQQQQIEVTRELPYPGEIMVKPGDITQPDTLLGVNRYAPPRLYVVTLFDKAGIELNRDNVAAALRVKAGDEVRPGDVLAEVGQNGFLQGISGQHKTVECPVRARISSINVDSGTIVMREIQDYPTTPQVVDIARRLALKPKHIMGYLSHHKGEFIYAGDTLAKRLVGSKTSVKSDMIVKAPSTGRIVNIDTKTGKLTIKYDVKPWELLSGVKGQVKQVSGQRSVQINCNGYNLNGVIGFGQENAGPIYYTPDLNLANLPAGAVVVVPTVVNLNFLQQAAAANVSAVVAASAMATDIKTFCNQELGVALTGQENIPYCLVLLQGFGSFELSPSWREFFVKHQGNWCWVSGRTQIRAGVIRPQLVIQV